MSLMDLQRVIPDLLPKLNSATKYPSIPTYHAEAGRGLLSDEMRTPFPAGVPVLLQEKVNGWNARVIVGPGWWLIGSRDHLLTANGDIVANPEGGIVDALRPVARLVDYDALLKAVGLDLPITWEPIITLHMEVYGAAGSVKGWDSYGNGKLAGYRLFDVSLLDAHSVLPWPIERIASWRDQGGQNFMHQGVVGIVAGNAIAPQTLPRVPILGAVDSSELPATVEQMAATLEAFSETRAALNGSPGEAEGIILRTTSRSIIAKAHLHRYRRTLQERAEQERLAAKASRR